MVGVFATYLGIMNSLMSPVDGQTRLVCAEEEHISAASALVSALKHVNVDAWPGLTARVELLDDGFTAVIERVPSRPGSFRVVRMNHCGGLIRVGGGA